MRKTIAIALLPLYLAACGGAGGSATASKEADSVVLSGQVVDGPIAGAQVCLLSDGVQVRDTNGTAICSSQTDANGAYSIKIPLGVPLGFLTLVATKDSYIKLASTLGTFSQVMAAAGNGGTVTPASLPGSRVTHFTTANLALADTNNDGTVSMSEFNAYLSDFTKVRKVAAIVKAVIDFGQAGSLIGGQTNDTLALASAAARDQALGTTGKTTTQWLVDPANANVLAAVDQDVSADMAGKFSNYQFSTVVTSSHTPPVVTVNNGTASIYCQANGTNESTTVQIALDAVRGIVVLKHEDGQITGSYNPETGAVSLAEENPLAVSMATPTITYYSEGSFNMNGTVNASTGNITGTYSESTATTWTLNSTRQECTAGGTFTATKL